MKYKLLFLLPVFALALAAGLTNCAKDTEATGTTVTDQPATERGNCLVRIITDGPAQICGTQTNTDYCGLVPGQTWATWPGVETIGAGTTVYTLSTPCDFSVSNTGAGVLNVKVQTPNNFIIKQIAPGGAVGYHVDNVCELSTW